MVGIIHIDFKFVTKLTVLLLMTQNLILMMGDYSYQAGLQDLGAPV
jgi:hypothetical protein